MITKKTAIEFVSFGVDDALNIHPVCNIPSDLSRVRFVGWQCGFEPMVIAVWSYLPGCSVDDAEAEELAVDALSERGWFTDKNEPSPADFVL